MAKHNGMIIWQGASALDGAPLVAIAVGINGSSNRKTGSMLQTYILRADMAPLAAVKTGADSSICGSCPHRGDGTGKGRTCYVNIGQGATSVYKAFMRGRYPVANRDDIRALGAGRMVRLGTYGDPAAVPALIWRDLISSATGHTGYTHQWRNVGAEWAQLVMASADTQRDALDAQALGYRTFRVETQALHQTAPLPREALCPASEAAGKVLQCATCGSCNGANGRRGSIWIPAHGGTAVMANVPRLIARLAA